MRFLWWSSWIAALRLLPSVEALEIVSALLEDAVLVPSQPYQLKVAVDQAKFMPFSCRGGPADVVISLSTYSEKADPLLFVSLDPKKAPSFQSHDGSSFSQWREDKAGDHYVITKAVGPKGGILGLVNMQHFAEEELDAVLSIHCTFIIAFDTLFWDHLRSSSVCPVGNHLQNGQVIQASNFCSGHGKCGKHGLCLCDGDFTGPACEHGKSDVVVAADGHYAFKVTTGKYQYFRIRIPPKFPGGYLEVKVMAQQPLVVLVRGDDLPTKSSFELSNFDDWINGRYISVLKFKVPSILGDVSAVPFGQIGMGNGRRLEDNMSRGADIHGIAGPRSLQQTGSSGSTWTADCSDLAPMANTPACSSQPFQVCQSNCQRCMGCVKGGSGSSGDLGCTDACNACIAPSCINLLSECAGDQSCASEPATSCESKCGSCLTCLDSNDAMCQGCDCCIRCLPLAAKCSIKHDMPAEYKRFVFVGVYNHRHFYSDSDVVHAAADISLMADPSFNREDLPSSWIADLYDPFHDIRSLEVTQHQVYPTGQQFIYNLQITEQERKLKLQVRVYRDRMTLLHITNPPDTANMALSFNPQMEITHILSSSKAAPKTFFDFDQMHAKEVTTGSAEVVSFQVPVLGKTTMWVAVFGASDMLVELDARSVAVATQAPAIGFALVCVFGLLCALLVLGVIYGGAQKLGDFFGMDPSIPLMERLGCLVSNRSPHESTASLTRAGSLSGYVGSDVIDRSVEDQYLHRGGAGDDGI